MMKFYVLGVALLCVASGIQSVELAEDSTMSRNLREVKSDFEIFQQNSGVSAEPECTLKQRLEANFRRTGENLTSVTSESTPERCALYCAFWFRECVAINYNTEENVCYYLRSVTGIVADSKYTTASLSSSLREICSSGNIVEDFVQGGPGLPDNPHILQSAEECCALCYITQDCIAYDYVTSGKQCFLKKSVSDITSKEGTSTGIVCPFVFG